jgi:predicted lipid-binding transport protein (Tim44 family)
MSFLTNQVFGEPNDKRGDKKMKKNRMFLILVVCVLSVFAGSMIVESSAWARAGRGGSFGSRGSRSYTAPKSPSSPFQSSPGFNSPGRSPGIGSPGFFGRSPFMQGLAGGLAGGLLGSLLFGGMGHAAAGGVGGGGIGFLDIILIGALLYFGWRFLKRRRAQTFPSQTSRFEPLGQAGSSPRLEEWQQHGYIPSNEVAQGLEQLKRTDTGLNEEALKDSLQDVFFRIQAAWANRSLDGVVGMFTPEMAEYFREEFAAMRRKGQINRLENIAVRKVEVGEIWQETGKDYVTVLFTANLLDYTVDEATGQVVAGDRTTPVKFQELWTFCRETGSSGWKLSAINQSEEASERLG